MFYSVYFQTVIRGRGHYFYKFVWRPCDGKMLNCVKDKRGEVTEYDKNGIGVSTDRTPSQSEQKMLVGNVPIELSSLPNNFLKPNESNKLAAKVSGKRKRQVGLVVPAKFKALAMEYSRLAKILDEQLQARKQKYTHFWDRTRGKIIQKFPVMY